jgi:hypothetical protein
VGPNCHRLVIERVDGEAVGVRNEFSLPNQLESWLYSVWRVCFREAVEDALINIINIVRV